MMENKHFCVFILTHGRPDNVLTYETLQKCNYTGESYFVIDDEDSTLDKYKRNFGEQRVIVFDKKKMADSIDEANNFDNRKVVVHARNACFQAARELNVCHFLQLDDDYNAFRYKFTTVKQMGMPKNIDCIFDLVIDYLKSVPALSIAFAQEGDFLGGIETEAGAYRFSKRKCMNSFFCSSRRHFQFVGSINEDVNTYVTLGSRGALFLTIPVVAVCQKATQSQAGGMTEIYKSRGTYIKSFSTVLMQPSAVTVDMMRSKHPRLHHHINWPSAVPVIVSDEHRKG